jgi:hypothetical protein
MPKSEEDSGIDNVSIRIRVPLAGKNRTYISVPSKSLSKKIYL